MSNNYTYSNKLFTVSEAGSILGMSNNTVRRWERSGKIEVERTSGGHRRISTGEVERVLFEKRVKSQKRNGYKRRSVFKSKYTQLSSRTYHLRSSAYNLRRLLRSNRRKTIPALLIPLIILISIAGYITFRPSETEATWFNDNWEYRKAVTVSNAGIDQTDYQVAISLDTTSLVSAGKLQSDCDDIRIVSKNKVLDYWVDTGAGYACNTTNTRIWVKVPSITTSGITIYLYYGNPQASSASNGDNTFIFFDDFEDGTLNKWTTVAAGGIVYSAGTSRVNGGTYSMSVDDNSGSNAARIYTAFDQQANYAVDFAWQIDVDANKCWLRLIGDQTFSYSAPMRDGQFASHNGSGWTNHYNVAADTWYYFSYDIQDIADETYDMYVYNSSGTLVDTTSNRGSYVNGATYSDTIDYRTDSSNQNQFWVDNLFVRKSATTPPAAGAPGYEQSQTRGPIAYWKFDEGADNTCVGGEDACDSTANANDGTFGTTTAAPTWQSEDLCVDGNCLWYDGTDDYIDADETLLKTLSEGTISAWVKGNSSNSGQIVVMGDANASSYYSFGSYSGYFGVRYMKAGADTFKGYTSTSVSDDLWHHVVLTVDSGGNTIYIDGEAKIITYDQGSASNAQFYSDNSANWDNIQIGRRQSHSGSGGYWNGFIDEVKIYSYARSADEVKKDYNRGAQVLGRSDDSWLSDGLIGYWDMDDGDINSHSCELGGSVAGACDGSGNGDHGTAYGSMTDSDFIAGQFGSSLNFDGSNDYLLGTINSPINDEFTLSFWEYNTHGNSASDAYVSLAINNTGASRSLGIGWSNNTGTYINKLLLATSNSGITISPDSLLSDTNAFNGSNNAWRLVTLTIDKEFARIYYDGVEDETYRKTVTSGSISIPSGDNFIIAKRYNASSYVQGRLDEVRMYDRALTPSEVSKLYQWAPGPVAHWKMDEGSWNNDCSTDTVFDSSGNGNDGDACPNATGPTGGAIGKYGNAGEFDGSDDLVVIPDSSNLDFSTGGFTVEAWVKANELQSGYFVQIVDREDTGDEFSLLFNNGATPKTLRWYVNDGDWQYTESTSTFSAPTDWIHVAGVYDGAQLLIYVNGVKEGTPTSQGNPANTSQPIGIGAAQKTSNAGRELDGFIDDVRIYNYARTPQQIVQDMNAGHPAPGSPVGSALGHWSFDEGYGQTTNDKGFGGNDGTRGADSGSASDDPTWTVGSSCKINGCLEIDGSNDYVNLPDAPDWDTSSITLSGWFYPQTFTASDKLFVRDDGTSDRVWQLQLSGTSGAMQFLGKAPTTWEYNLTTTSNLIQDAWNHVVVTVDSNTDTAKVYINGTVAGSDTASGDLVTSSRKIEVGGTSNGSYSFDGYIDELQIYNSALTTSQVKVLYNQGSVSFGVLGDSEASDLTDGAGNPPIAHWSMDEGSWNNDCSTDTVFDISGNENHGDACPNSTGPTGNANGKYGNAGEFDDVDDYIDMGGTDDFKFTTQNYTVSGWVYYYSLANDYYVLIDKSDYQGSTLRSGYSLYANYWGDVRYYVQNYSSFASISYSLTNLEANRWYYLTGVADNTNNLIHLYVNGKNVGSAAYTFDTGWYAEPNLRIGRSSDLDNPVYVHYGKIDDVKIYNYARSPAQVAYDFNRGKPIGHWKLDECQGVTAYDSGSGGNNGTITAGDTSGSNDSVGTCSSGAGDEMWDNGTTGKRNASLDFDGTNDLVTIADNTDLQPSSAFTIGAWIYPNDCTTDRIVSKWDGNSSGTDDGGIIVDTYDGTTDGCGIRMWIYDSADTAQVTSSSGNVLNQNEWNYITVTFDSGTMTTYVDGVQQTTGALGETTIPDSSFKWGIGEDGDGPGSANEYFNGKIDDVRIYNYSLSETQIRKIMNESAVRFGPNEGSP